MVAPRLVFLLLWSDCKNQKEGGQFPLLKIILINSFYWLNVSHYIFHERNMNVLKHENGILFQFTFGGK